MGDALILNIIFIKNVDLALCQTDSCTQVAIKLYRFFCKVMMAIAPKAKFLLY